MFIGHLHFLFRCCGILTFMITKSREISSAPGLLGRLGQAWLAACWPRLDWPLLLGQELRGVPAVDRLGAAAGKQFVEKREVVHLTNDTRPERYALCSCPLRSGPSLCCRVSNWLCYHRVGVCANRCALAVPALTEPLCSACVTSWLSGGLGEKRSALARRRERRRPAGRGYGRRNRRASSK